MQRQYVVLAVAAGVAVTLGAVVLWYNWPDKARSTDSKTPTAKDERQSDEPNAHLVVANNEDIVDINASSNCAHGVARRDVEDTSHEQGRVSQQASSEASASGTDPSLPTDNEIAVHELMLQEPRSHHTPSGRHALENVLATQIRTVAVKAFLDCLREQLSSSDPPSNTFVPIIEDVREVLLTIIPSHTPQGRALAALIHEQLDMDYVRMRLAASLDVPYLRMVLDFFIYIIMQLQPPSQRAATADGYSALLQSFGQQTIATPRPRDCEAPALPSAFRKDDQTVEMLLQATRFLYDTLERLRHNITQERIAMLQTYLRGSSNGVEYERQRLERMVAGKTVVTGLPLTVTWCAAAYDSLKADNAAAVAAAATAAPHTVAAVVARGMMALIRRPHAIAPSDCPETLLLDLRRIFEFQNEVQRLCLTAVSILVAQQLLAARQVPTLPTLPANQTFYRTVKERFLVLLAQDDIHMDAITAEMSGLLQKRCAEHGTGVAASGDDDLVNRMVDRIYSTNDPIYKKVQSGILAALEMHLTSGGSVSMNGALRPVGAELLTAEIVAFATAVSRVMQHNVAVCFPFYQTILRHCASQ